jgi:nucleotide-binding universal stress UspA family protein
MAVIRQSGLLLLLALFVTASAGQASAQRVKPVRTKATKVVVKKQRVPARTRTIASPLRVLKTKLASAPTRRLADGMSAIFSKKVEGISQPHPEVVKQIAEAAGGKLRGSVYVVQYGTPAAEQVTALAKENGVGMIYKGSAGNGHSMAWVGGHFTDAVPGRNSFSNGAKTRFHEFKPLSERPQIVAAFDLPKSIIGKATQNAAKMAESKKQCGADCSGYVREIMLTTSAMAKEAGSSNSIAQLSTKMQNYQAPTRLRNTSLGLADVVILMVSKNDWRNPASAGYTIHDWNGK